MIHKKAVEKALKNARVKYKTSATSKVLHLLCPFHADKKTPSLVIYTDEPVHFHCFSCNSHGDWNTLATIIKAGELENDWDDPEACSNLRKIIRTININPCLPYRTKPWMQGSFRECTPRLLQSLHTRWWFDEIDRVERVVWPVWDSEAELVGWVGRRLDKNNEVRKYRNAPAMKALETLWPLPRIGIYPETKLVLVEGPYDALRLLSNGIPALSLLGTNWSDTRTSIIYGLGIKRATLGLDRDSAGRSAMFRIGKDLTRNAPDIELDIWEWPEGTDPGNAPLEEIRNLRNHLNIKHGGIHPWIELAPRTQVHWLPENEQV